MRGPECKQCEREEETGKERKRVGGGRKSQEALPRVPMNGLAQEFKRGTTGQGHRQRGSVRPAAARTAQRMSGPGSGVVRGAPEGLCTHSMGFPLISDMMELSPPRYS